MLEENTSLSVEQIKKMVAWLEENQQDLLFQELESMHPADISEFISNIELEESITILRKIEWEKTAKILIEIDENLNEKIIELFSIKEIAQIIKELNSDDAVDIIAHIGVEKREQVIKTIDDREHAESIVELLRYEENTAGGLMGKELVSINENWDINTSLVQIKIQAEKVSKIHSIYVVDEHMNLKGRISIKDLLTTSPDKKIKDCYISNIRYLNVYEDTDEVVRVMSRYDLESVPVVDELGRLIGRITIDDVIDIIQEEAEKDYQLAAGITQDIEYRDGLWQSIKGRLPWLIIGSIGGLGAASVISGFDLVMKQFPMLMIFIPLIQSTAGNVGVQSSAIIVQSIAKSELSGNITKRILKEILIGLVNGLAITTIVSFIGIFVFGMSTPLLLTIGISLIVVIINAGIISTFIPFFLNKNNINPAVATGPFVTTAGDIIGILIYFYIAKLLLGL